MASESKGLMQYLFRGTLFCLPIAVTLFLLKFAFNLSEEWLGGIARDVARWLLPQSWLVWPFADGNIPGLSLVLLVVVLVMVGRIASWHFGREKLRLIDLLFLRIPGVRAVYSAVRHMVEALSDERKDRFKRVVFLEWPAKGTRVLGFVTGENDNVFTGRHELCVFIAHAPNPTSGFVVWVPVEDTVDSGLTPQEAFKLIMSGGVLAPPVLPVTKPPVGGAGANKPSRD